MEVFPIPNHATLPDMPSATNADHDGRYVNLAGDTMTGILNMGGNDITDTGDVIPVGPGKILGNNLDDQLWAGLQIDGKIGLFNGPAYYLDINIGNSFGFLTDLGNDIILNFDGLGGNTGTFTYRSDDDVFSLNADTELALGLTVNTTDLVVDATTHRVGIKVVNPERSLDIIGIAGVTDGMQYRTSAITVMVGEVFGVASIFVGTGRDLTVFTNVERVRFKADGKVGFGEFSPETLIELTSTEPYLTLHNSTEDDANGSGGSRLIFKREDGAGTETEAGRIEVSHNGTGVNDQLSRMELSINRGSGVQPALVIDSDGTVDIIDGLTVDTGVFTVDSITDAVTVKGTTNLGDGTNETQISATGVQTMHGTARVKVHHIITPGALILGSAPTPSLANEGDFAVVNYSGALAQDAHFNWHPDEEWDDTVQPTIKIYWVSAGSPVTPEEVQWLVTYNAINAGEAIGAGSSGTSGTTLYSNTVATAETLIETAEFTFSNIAHDDILGIKIERLGNADDSGDVARIVQIEIEYTINKLGATS